VKCLRALQYIPTPDDPEYRAAEVEVIEQVFASTTTVRNGTSPHFPNPASLFDHTILTLFWQNSSEQKQRGARRFVRSRESRGAA
jgi:transposase-like protein